MEYNIHKLYRCKEVYVERLGKYCIKELWHLFTYPLADCNNFVNTSFNIFIYTWSKTLLRVLRCYCLNIEYS